jgi:hypothetical protein
VQIGDDPEKIRIMLSLLDCIERDSAQSHRRLSSELGIALGLTNSYVRRCVKKGYLKVRKSKPNTFTYNLTPRGFLEKAQLSARYLSHSFSFFRHARNACAAAFTLAEKRGYRRIALAGVSDLAEIAIICATERKASICAIVDREAKCARFVGVPVVKDFSGIAGGFDAIIVTDLTNTRDVLAQISKQYGPDCVIAPSLLDSYRREMRQPSCQ